MSDQFQPIELPVIREHDFRSQAPLIGPLVRLLRRGVYSIAARWGVAVVIEQQNRINRMIAQELNRRLSEQADLLREYEARLIEQDRDLAHVSRAMAELQVRQRYLLRLVQSPSSATEPSESDK